MLILLGQAGSTPLDILVVMDVKCGIVRRVLNAGGFLDCVDIGCI
jgi:hypothetical protein